MFCENFNYLPLGQSANNQAKFEACPNMDSFGDQKSYPAPYGASRCLKYSIVSFNLWCMLGGSV